MKPVLSPDWDQLANALVMTKRPPEHIVCMVVSLSYNMDSVSCNNEISTPDIYSLYGINPDTSTMITTSAII